MEAYSQLWKAIIRPPRTQYEIKDLGPTEFNIGGGVTVVRTDFELPSARNHKMQCSHFEPLESQR